MTVTAHHRHDKYAVLIEKSNIALKRYAKTISHFLQVYSYAKRKVIIFNKVNLGVVAETQVPCLLEMPMSKRDFRYIKRQTVRIIKFNRTMQLIFSSTCSDNNRILSTQFRIMLSQILRLCLCE